VPNLGKESGTPDLSWAVGARDRGFEVTEWKRRRRLAWFGRERVFTHNLSAASLMPSLTPNGGHQVNAAFLLVTTAWLTGADPAPAPAMTPAPAMAAPAPVVVGGGNSCGSCGTSSCDSGCGCGRHHFRGLFARHHGCGCDTCAAPAPTCCAPAPAPAPAPCCAAPAPTCESGCGCGHRHGGLLSGLCRHHRGCGCETACNSCGGCDGCGTASGAPPAVMPGPAPAPGAERVPPPGTPAKKMPAAPKTTQNYTPETAPVPVSTPAFQNAPAIVPNVPADADRKEPF
jgi:hypothetical protein